MTMHGRELGDWLDDHVPREQRGSAQNWFRMAVTFFASQSRYTLEEALDFALRKTREQYPDFTPKILP